MELNIQQKAQALRDLAELTRRNVYDQQREKEREFDKKVKKLRMEQ